MIKGAIWQSQSHGRCPECRPRKAKMETVAAAPSVAMTVKNDKCSQLFALLVEKKPLFLSNGLVNKPVYCRECYGPPTRNNW